MIGNEDALSVYELHIAVKDHCFGFGREDRLVGVAVMQLKDIEDQVMTHYGEGEYFKNCKVHCYLVFANLFSKLPDHNFQHRLVVTSQPDRNDQPDCYVLLLTT